MHFRVEPNAHLAAEWGTYQVLVFGPILANPVDNRGAG
jgi:hypothetical protein